MFNLYYYDQDQDKIEISLDSDLNILYQLNNKVKLFIEKPEEPELLDLINMSDDEVTIIDDPIKDKL
jgi:hypothetical protein